MCRRSLVTPTEIYIQDYMSPADFILRILCLSLIGCSRNLSGKEQRKGYMLIHADDVPVLGGKNHIL